MATLSSAPGTGRLSVFSPLLLFLSLLPVLGACSRYAADPGPGPGTDGPVASDADGDVADAGGAASDAVDFVDGSARVEFDADAVADADAHADPYEDAYEDAGPFEDADVGDGGGDFGADGSADGSVDGSADAEFDAGFITGDTSTFGEVETDRPNPGSLRSFFFAPSRMPNRPRPLVVALHGCTLSAEDYYEGAGWRDVAEREKFWVLYPGQSRWNNANLCFNWFSVFDSTRGEGEVGSIFEMVEWARDTHPIDGARIIVTGLSAGAFMAVAMAATYPDVFAGAVIHAGGPYRCASNFLEGLTCMAGRNASPSDWLRVLTEDNGFLEPPGFVWPRLLVWHGLNDDVVVPMEATELVEQWTAAHGVDAVADAVQQIGRTTIRRAYHDATGRSVVVTYLTETMGHAVQIAPGRGCGLETSRYFADVGVCAAQESSDFFELAR
ncbi:MAG: PHB depolymerase family esterase [Deltaproteobacteria bacterium]|nr:PHB depolymerase family esterase [Deltaproteobacteria bacterium]